MLETIRYIPRDFERTASHLEIRKITVSAYPPHGMKSPDSIKKTNHWNLQLECANGESILLNPVPVKKQDSSAYYLAVLLSEDRSFDSVDSVWVKTTELGVQRPLTVGGLVEIIKDERLDMYEYPNGGPGCRCWLYEVLRALGDRERVREEDLVEAKKVLDRVWVDDGSLAPEEEQTPMIPGKFLEHR